MIKEFREHLLVPLVIIISAFILNAVLDYSTKPSNEVEFARNGLQQCSFGDKILWQKVCNIPEDKKC